MESKNSIEITKLNKEYLELYYSSEYQRFLRKNRIKQYLKTFDIGSIYKACLANLHKRNLRDKFIVNEEKHNINYDDNYDKKLVIYTCIVGDYDRLNEPRYVNNNCKYIVITDQEVPKNSIWEKIDINKYSFLEGMSNTEKNRYIKLHPHIIFEDYDYSIYIDGNILVVGDLYPIINSMGQSFLAIHNHPLRNCIYTEGKAVIQTKKANRADVKKQISFYKKQGYPEHNGLYENTILVREHNNPLCKKIMDEWWSNMNEFTMRDQLSLPYVLWKNGVENVYSLGTNLKLNPRFRYIKHNL